MSFNLFPFTLDYYEKQQKNEEVSGARDDF